MTTGDQYGRISRLVTRGKPQRGFTLVELMVVVAIIAILASIAIPSYRAYMIRAHRAEAKAQMMEIASREQQFLLANRVYADKATLVANGFSTPADLDQYYNWDVAVGAAGIPSFLITFTPIGSQTSDGPLTLDQAGTKTPADKWKR